MDLLEPLLHSFVIKIWLEESAAGDGGEFWRGRITHVASGEECYFLHVAAIAAFITPYLKRRGARPTLRERIRGWLERRRRKDEGA